MRAEYCMRENAGNDACTFPEYKDLLAMLG
jgi:hypothetical protein